MHSERITSETTSNRVTAATTTTVEVARSGQHSTATKRRTPPHSTLHARTTHSAVIQPLPGNADDTTTRRNTYHIHRIAFSCKSTAKTSEQPNFLQTKALKG